MKPDTKAKYDIATSMAGKTVMVAGGAGFLGSHLCRAHLDRGARVICVDNLSTGRFSNISSLLDDPDFAFVQHDVIQKFEPAGPIDFIFNMASPASPPKYQLDPIATFETNVIGSENLLKLASQTGARILQASTSEVYGDPLISQQVENYRGNVQTMGPRSLKWSCFLGQFCGLAKMHLVCVHAAFRISAWPKYAMSGVRLSRAV